MGAIFLAFAVWTLATGKAKDWIDLAKKSEESK